MTFEQQEKLFSKFTEEQRAIMFKKGNDYAGADRLSNFKVTGAITQLSAEQAALQMIATKVARLGVLLQPGKVANNESIDDSVVDLANYAFLLVCLLREPGIEADIRDGKFQEALSKLKPPVLVGDSGSTGGSTTIIANNNSLLTFTNDTREGLPTTILSSKQYESQSEIRNADDIGVCTGRK